MSATRHDTAAFGELLAAHEGRLRLLLLHLSGPAVRARVEVDDLLQEVFLRALSAPPERRADLDAAGLRSWLTTIARHTVIDVVRAARAMKRSAREERLQRSDWSRTGAFAAPGAGPVTRLQGDELATRLTRSWLELSPEHRRVIGLRQFEGLSAADTARRMGRSETAVHSLYRRALEAWEGRLQ